MNTFKTFPTCNFNRYVILLAVLFAYFFPALAQQDAKDLDKLQKTLLIQLNDVRTNIGITSLQTDNVLEKAAQNHADYLSKSKEISLTQKSGKAKTVAGRVKLAKGDFESALQLVFTVENGTTLSKKAFETACLQFWNEALQSDSARFNLLNPAYGKVGFAWSKQKTKNAMVLSVVLGRVGITIPGQLSKNAFGLKRSDTDCSSIFSQDELLLLCNSIYIEGNEVKLEYHNKRDFQLLFPGAQDGIAIDVVHAEQFPCFEPNALDRSPLYDGILLAPVYRDQLLQSNESNGDFRLKTTLGIIPDAWTDKQLLPNLIYIRNGQACSYRVIHYVEGDDYGLAPIEPTFNDPQTVLSETGSVRTVSYSFDFDQAKTTPLGKMQLDLPKDSLFFIEVLSFSSIEGDSVSNRRLHETRAKNILQLAENQLGKIKVPVKVTVAENWERCYFQLELLELDSIAALPKNKIRAYVISDTLHNWDSLLRDQRVSTIIYHIKGKRDSILQREAFFQMNVRTALLTGNLQQANRALMKMYRENQPTSLLLEPGILDRLLSEKDLVQNASALLTHHFNPKDLRIISFVRNWLRDPSTLNEASKRNLIHLYNLSTYTLIEEEWDIKNAVFINILNPARLEHFFQDRPVSTVYDLNYYLTSLNYTELEGNYAQVQNSFDKIETFLLQQQMDAEQLVKICLFFNYWSQFQTTIDVLSKRMTTPEFSKNEAALLAQTATTVNGFRPVAQLNEIYDKVMELNPETWCSWLLFDFQLYREEGLKERFCTSCQEKK